MTIPKRKAKKAPAVAKRTIGCRLCRRQIEFSIGLSEMSDHWELEHPEALEKLRANLGHEREER